MNPKKQRTLKRQSRSMITARLSASNTRMRAALKLARGDLVYVRDRWFLPHSFGLTLDAIEAALDERVRR